jgi:hypothetical protein
MITENIFNASDSNYLCHSLQCLYNFNGQKDNLDQINIILNRLYKDYKNILILDLPPEAVDEIDDFRYCGDNNEGFKLWFAKYNPTVKSLIQAIVTILYDIQTTQFIVTEMVLYLGLDKIWHDYFNWVYILEDHIKIAHELIKKRLDRRKKGLKVGSNPTELKGVMKAIVEYINVLESRGINGSIKRHEVVISFSEIIWNHFKRFTSDAPYCFDIYEVYVDKEFIFQADNKRIRKRSKKTFMNYVSKAKKIAQSKKDSL